MSAESSADFYNVAVANVTDDLQAYLGRESEAEASTLSKGFPEDEPKLLHRRVQQLVAKVLQDTQVRTLIATRVWEEAEGSRLAAHASAPPSSSSTETVRAVPGHKTRVACSFTNHCRNYGLIIFPTEDRAVFPAYKTRFTLLADGRALSVWVTSAPNGTRAGDPAGGKYIVGGLQRWYSLHPELQKGDTLWVETLEPMKTYLLSVESR